MSKLTVETPYTFSIVRWQSPPKASTLDMRMEVTALKSGCGPNLLEKYRMCICMQSRMQRSFSINELWNIHHVVCRGRVPVKDLDTKRSLNGHLPNMAYADRLFSMYLVFTIRLTQKQ